MMLFLRFLCLLAFSYLENVAYTGMPSLVTLGNQLSTVPCIAFRNVGEVGLPRNLSNSRLRAAMRPLRSKIPAVQSGGRLCCFSNADKISGPRPTANT